MAKLPVVRLLAGLALIGSHPPHIIGADAVVERVRQVAESKQYRDNPVLATIKVLAATGALVE